ncbi:MAG: hypothetical protein H0T89_01290 [Deltaproteobacteria bacterium]|nr:hypothetical protein [Deltaproteobacteria bacterium]MDQ3298932.1 hypothetical protein [Myxococcota bacterium]
MLQLRLAHGLVYYPRGRSAMVLYAHAPDLRAAARTLASAHQALVARHALELPAGHDLLCRHLIEIDGTTDLAAFCAKLRTEFERRFGAIPLFERAP